MKKRSFISILILFSYTVGFSHYLIPHCDVSHEESTVHDSEEHGVHFHQHHDEDVVGHDEDHEHYKHADHFDEGLYDLLVCFLSAVEHPETETCLDPFVFKTAEKTTSSLKNDQVLLATVFGIISNFIILTNEKKVFLNPSDFYHSPPILYSPTRGPPTISC